MAALLWCVCSLYFNSDDVLSSPTPTLLRGSPSGSPSTTTSAESRETEQCEYDLVGIVVHQGGCNAGHYLSYVKERKLPSAAAATGADKWIEFNDDQVSDFDPARIPAETFGGYGTNDTHRGGRDSIMSPPRARRGVGFSESDFPGTPVDHKTVLHPANTIYTTYPLLGAVMSRGDGRRVDQE